MRPSPIALANDFLADYLADPKTSTGTPLALIGDRAALAHYLFADPSPTGFGDLAPWTASPAAHAVRVDSEYLTGAWSSCVHRDWHDTPALAIPHTSEGDVAHGYPDHIGQANRATLIGDEDWDSIPGCSDCACVGLVLPETVLTGEAAARLEALASALEALGYDEDESDGAILNALDADPSEFGTLDDLTAAWDALQDLAAGLCDYPVLDDCALSEIEYEAQEEEWKSCVHQDFQGEIAKRTGIDLPYRAVDDLRCEAADATGRYPEAGGHGCFYWPIEDWAEWIARTRAGRAALASVLLTGAEAREVSAGTDSVDAWGEATLAHEEDEGGPIPCGAVRDAIAHDAPTCPALQVLSFPGFDGKPSRAATLWDDGERISILLADGSLVLAQTRPEHPDQGTLFKACAECGQPLHEAHLGRCGKRVLGADGVVPEDCGTV